MERPGGPMDYEYKCVAAPEKARRRRGAKTRSARVAMAMEDILKAESGGGWEYQRTDLLPVEEKSGLFGRTQEVHRAVLVFRRAVASSRPTPVHAPVAAQPTPVAAEPVPVAAPVAPVAAPVEVQETPAPIPAASETDGDFRLAAQRQGSAAAPSGEPLRAPKGLS